MAVAARDAGIAESRELKEALATLRAQYLVLQADLLAAESSAESSSGGEALTTCDPVVDPHEHTCQKVESALAELRLAVADRDAARKERDDALLGIERRLDELERRQLLNLEHREERGAP